MEDYASYTIEDWMRVNRANETDIFTMRPRAEVEAEQARQSAVDYLFPAINSHQKQAVKLYDAETGKVTDAILETEEPVSHSYLRGMVVGLAIGMIGILVTEFLLLWT